jgi:hypothetical protein
MSMTAAGLTVPVSIDVLGYAVGRDELALTTFVVGRTFSTQTEQELSSLLISRALTNPH